MASQNSGASYVAIDARAARLLPATPLGKPAAAPPREAISERRSHLLRTQMRPMQQRQRPCRAPFPPQGLLLLCPSEMACALWLLFALDVFGLSGAATSSHTAPRQARRRAA
jgi:hypothetical protein